MNRIVLVKFVSCLLFVTINNSYADTPIITSFEVASSSTGATVAITSLTATNPSGIWSWNVSPTTSTCDAGLLSAKYPKPTSYTFDTRGEPQGVSRLKTLCAYAADSNHHFGWRMQMVSIFVPDTTLPVISSFAIPAISSSLVVPITNFTSTDNVLVTGYCLSEISNFAGCIWRATAPASYTFTSSGTKTVYAFVKDNAGNSASSSATTNVLSDTTGPTLTLSTLTNGAKTNNATLSINGTVSDPNGVKNVTVNAIPVTITSGTFSYAVTILPGSNIITTVATDTLGNTTTDTRTITLDVTVPTLTVNAPADNSKTVQSAVAVSGTIDETSTVTIKINSGTLQSVAITGTTYSATANLTSGLNTITITATDLATNTSSAVRTVTYDNSNPSLSITNPNQDITTVLGSVTISGTVSDTITVAVVTITADGQTYTPAVAQNGSFTQNIPLPTDKAYAVVATATDQAGNSTTVQRNIIKATPLTQPTISDALKVLQTVFGITTLTDSEKIRFDVAPFASNGTPLGNGIIDAADVIAILRRSIGIGSW